MCNYYLAWSFVADSGVMAAPAVSQAVACRAAFSSALFFSLFRLFLVPRLGSRCASLHGKLLSACFRAFDKSVVQKRDIDLIMDLCSRLELLVEDDELTADELKKLAP